MLLEPSFKSPWYHSKDLYMYDILLKLQISFVVFLKNILKDAFIPKCKLYALS